MARVLLATVAACLLLTSPSAIAGDDKGSGSSATASVSAEGTTTDKLEMLYQAGRDEQLSAAVGPTRDLGQARSIATHRIGLVETIRGKIAAVGR